MEDHTTLFGDRTMITFSRIAVIMLIVYLGALSLSTLKGLRFIGAGVPATNTISVTGTGEAFAVPDTAEFTATVIETAKDVQSAQSAADAKANAVTGYLKGAGVGANDIQTTDYSISPQYEYQQVGACMSAYCPPGKQVITGYQVSETLDVKVRDMAQAGNLLAGVGVKGASQVSGLTWTVSNRLAIEAEARDKAIADAKAKAQTLAGSLGVTLVRIVGYSENSVSPIRFAANSAGSATLEAIAAPAPEISAGQNKITSNITISYEIE